jgi:hypothetical protein
LPLHCVWFGAHMPVHAPLMHVWSMHENGEPQLPASPHVSKLLPVIVHWLVAGEQATQVLSRHAGVEPEHIVCVCQPPDALHVWMRFPKHRVWFGAHTPEHMPLRHVWSTQASQPAEASVGRTPPLSVVPSAAASATLSDATSPPPSPLSCPASPAVVWSGKASGPLLLASQSLALQSPLENSFRPPIWAHAPIAAPSSARAATATRPRT